MTLRNRGNTQREVGPTSTASVEPPKKTMDVSVATRLGVNKQSSCQSHGTTTKTMVSFDCAEAMILQGLAGVFLVAFLGAYYQNEGLMGDDGIMPARTTYWAALRQRFDDPLEGFQNSPSIFWFIDLSDDSMKCVIMSGIVLSSLVLVTRRSTWLWQASLWILYFSIVSTADGTSFYSYGWESQLLETAFLSIFLCPFPGQRGVLLGLWPSFAANNASTPVTRWLFRWLIFRITIGAGLIKLRGSSCWVQKTCLYYHFETQPIPSPLSFWYHFFPRWVHRRLIDLDFVVQVYASWFVLVPPIGWLGRWLLRLGGILQIGLMLGIIFSGNFAFLNHLTIIPALACLDDACWPRALRRLIQKWSESSHSLPVWRRAVDLTLLCAIVYQSWPVVSNLWGQTGQSMNRSFGNFRLVNTYGAFGSVGKERYEPIISVGYFGDDWTEIEFPCKPGNIFRRPCFCAPYHYRLDWNIWFLGFKPHRAMLRNREQWLYQLLAKLLIPGNTSEIRRPWLDLLDPDTSRFLQTTFYLRDVAPRYAKVDMYRYQMTASLTEILSSQTKAWWNRTLTESLIPVVEWDPTQRRLKRVE